MNFQVQEKTVFFLNRLFYNPLILLSINLSPIALISHPPPLAFLSLFLVTPLVFEFFIMPFIIRRVKVEMNMDNTKIFGKKSN